MTLEEMSEDYVKSAAQLSARLAEIRKQLKTATDPDEIWHLRRRMAELSPMLTQMNELAELTRKYYDKSYYIAGKYTATDTRTTRASQEAHAKIKGDI